MTKINDVFMLPIDAKLDYKTLQKICRTGHSRIPVYEEVEVPDQQGQMVKVPKILGVFLVKQCVLLDPKGRSMLVPNNSSIFDIHIPCPSTQMPSLFARCNSIRSLPSTRTNLSSVYSINSRKVARTWPLCLVSVSPMLPLSRRP